MTLSFNAKLATINSFKEPGEIAEYLVEFGGMRGFKGANDSCPIAKYFRTEFDFTQSVKVYGKWTPTTDLTSGAFRVCVFINEKYSYYLSPTVQEFIEQFDDGAYPELDIE